MCSEEQLSLSLLLFFHPCSVSYKDGEARGLINNTTVFTATHQQYKQEAIVKVAYSENLL